MTEEETKPQESEESEESEEFDLSSQTEEELIRLHGDLLHQLSQFQRFRLFVAANYEIKVVKDDDTKTVRMVAMENTPEKAAQILSEYLEEVKSKSGIVVADEKALDLLDDLKKGKT